MLEEKHSYTIRELFDELDISILELSRMSKINEVTLARIRDGKSARRSTVNKLLNTFSSHYHRIFSMRNVTGINVQANRRLEARKAGKSITQEAA